MLSKKRWSAAYYLSGYAVECGLKACLLKHLGESDRVFGDPKYLRELKEGAWTHDLGRLIDLAGLRQIFDSGFATNPGFRASWQTVFGWSEVSRYQSHTEVDARLLWDAITNKPDGVFPWIQLHW